MNTTFLSFHIFTRAGCVIMTMIVEMEPTKENSAMLNIKHVRHKSLHARILSAYETSTVVMEKMIVVIDQMRWVVTKRKTVHVPRVSSPAQAVSALIITWFVTKWPTVRTSRTNLFIVMWMNVPRLKFINVDISALTL